MDIVSGGVRGAGVGSLYSVRQLLGDRLECVLLKSPVLARMRKFLKKGSICLYSHCVGYRHIPL